MTQLSEEFIHTIKRWHMADAALLFLAGHRSLAFVAGQGLHLLSPIAMLAGFEEVDKFASLLTERNGLAQLERQLKQKSKQK